ncbi:hypothetical protein B0I37DRAFT_36013 [Chaetomium sp. MPI-CAGE-AT-0009]|nr:hypothetical protein B0I37DRAFT_36013 [Chaetomium sp. MPI-CAGE-AT-0009]
MLRTIFFLLTLTLVTLVSAHGKVTVVTGDAGGNGTALGILGGLIPNAGPNLRVRLPAPSPSQPHKPPSYPTGLPPPTNNDNNNNKNTEADTTVFDAVDLLSDGLGRTAASGPNTIAMLIHAMRLSGTTLPQITPGGNLSGTFFVITTDGAGPIHAVLDPSATGKFSAGVPLPVVEQIPGGGGGGGGEDVGEGAEAEAGSEFVSSRKPALPKESVGRSVWARVVGVVAETGLGRAVRVWRRGAPDRVNQGFEFVFAVPANTTCTGVVADMTGVCLVKIANANAAGPFGGVVPVQMAVEGGRGNGAFAVGGGKNGTSASAAIAAICGRLYKE